MLKRCLSLLLILLCTTYLQAQDARDHNNAMAAFVTYYNNTAYDSIFYLFSADMKAALPMEKTKNAMTQAKQAYGKIMQKSFDKMQGSTAIYKVNFERGIFAIDLSMDKDKKISGLLLKPYEGDDLPKPERNTTKLSLPFSGTWTVFWGGDTPEQNYHVATRAQKNAFDILIMDKEGSTHKNDGKVNEDYYAFGKSITAPCDATVVMAVDGIKDNRPGDMNPIFLTGNSVIVRTANNEYMLFAHLKQYSVKVKEGDKVKQGQMLGLCGNTGNSSEPHLHFHIQNVENMNVATGVKCYFDKIMVDGAARTDYSPVKGDKVSNVE